MLFGSLSTRPTLPAGLGCCRRLCSIFCPSHYMWSGDTGVLRRSSVRTETFSQDRNFGGIEEGRVGGGGAELWSGRRVVVVVGDQEEGARGTVDDLEALDACCIFFDRD